MKMQKANNLQGMLDLKINFEEAKKLVVQTIAPGQNLTDEEVALYIYKCQRLGIDFMDRLLIPVKYKGKITFITTIDLMRSQADKTGEYEGQEAPIFEYDGNKIPVSCMKTVHRKEKKPFSNTVFYSEYVGLKADGTPNSFWRRMPHVMLAKCAEASVLRMAFPSALSGMYTYEEMDQANNHTQEFIPSPTREKTQEPRKAKALFPGQEIEERPIDRLTKDWSFEIDEDSHIFFKAGTLFTEIKRTDALIKLRSVAETKMKNHIGTAEGERWKKIIENIQRAIDERKEKRGNELEEIKNGDLQFLIETAQCDKTAKYKRKESILKICEKQDEFENIDVELKNDIMGILLEADEFLTSKKQKETVKTALHALEESIL